MDGARLSGFFLKNSDNASHHDQPNAKFGEFFRRVGTLNLYFRVCDLGF